MHLGKQPAQKIAATTELYPEVRRQLVTQDKKLAAVPSSFDNSRSILVHSPLGNAPDPSVSPDFKGCEDCVPAGAVWATQIACRAGGRAIPSFSSTTTIANYTGWQRLTGSEHGYDLETGLNDTGLEAQKALAVWQQFGLDDDNGNEHKIGQILALDPQNFGQLIEAAYLFGVVGLGMIMTSAQENQMFLGETLRALPNQTVRGPHWVDLTGTDGTNGLIINYGRRMSFDRSMLTQCDEAYVWIDNERYNELTDEDTNHFKQQDAEKYLSLLAAV